MTLWKQDPNKFPPKFHAWLREGQDRLVARCETREKARKLQVHWLAFRSSLRCFSAHPLHEVEMNSHARLKIRWCEEQLCFLVHLSFVDKRNVANAFAKGLGDEN